MRIARVLALCLLPSLAAAQPVQPVQILHEFPSAPWWPAGGLVQVPDGSLYGVTVDAIYRVATDGTVTVPARLTDGSFARGTMVAGPGGVLYGVTRFGGRGGKGTVFRFDPATSEVRTLHAFDDANDAGEPVGGLVLAGGFLYGATRHVLFKVDPSNGATTTEVRFGIDTPLFDPTSPLTRGADGQLYGTTGGGPAAYPTPSSGALYRFDPASRAVAVEYAFPQNAYAEGVLRLGADARLYGGSVGSSVGAYRFDPASDVFEVLFQVPGGPGPLLIAPDGSLYGTTFATTQVVPTPSGVLFRLRPSAGGYTFETLRTFDAGSTGLSGRAELTLGADGLIYGYSQYGGPANSGAVYRFDPSASGAPNLPLTVLHTFTPSTPWGPSAPVAGADGVLYGTTSRGGPAQRGAIYAVNPTTGAVTTPTLVPGTTTGTSTGWNSSLALGLDNALYGTTVMQTPSGIEHGVLRFVPATGVATTSLLAPDAGAERPAPDSPMVRAANGMLYFARNGLPLRFDPAAGTIAEVGALPLPPAGCPGRSTASSPMATGGQVYFVVGAGCLIPPYTFAQESRLMRINTATNALEEVLDLSSLGISGDVVFGSDNAFYGVRGLVSAYAIDRIDLATGSHQAVCTFPGDYFQNLSATPDGRLVAITANGPQRLLICTPSTGATEVRMLPPAIGRIRAPLVASGGALYGATWDQPYRPLVEMNGPAPVQPGGALIRLVLEGVLPPLDSDADGLPNHWETAYGLDAFGGTGPNGASGDPDGDGRTNAQELAEGTHPRGLVNRYFAEGATGPFFRTRIDLANPEVGATATVLLRFLTDTGARINRDVVLLPGYHASIDPATLAGLANATFSTVIESDVMVGVDRTMSWDPSGYGSHLETGVRAPSTTWYLAEGSTSGPFALFYLLQNPQPAPVVATVRYLRPFGQAPIDRTYTLPPNSRTTIVVDDQGAELASTDLSAVITASSPIVAERAMYYSQPGQVFAAGHESAGVTAPALEWFLAEGATGAFFDLFVLIANPNPLAATVEVEYLLVDGGSLTKTYTVAGNSRSTIWVDDEELPAASGVKPLADAALSMVVRSTNAVPIVVERTMWWPSPALTTNYWYEAHNSPGSTTTATRWVIAGAELGGPAAAQTYVLIANPGTTAGLARVWRLTSTGRQYAVITGEIPLPPKSRTNIPFPASGTFNLNETFGLLIESVGAQPVPIVVEHATYSSPGGVTWAAGGNALASPLP
jgi:uncharacterized repeat protein (TIGR03803 family)